MSTARSITAAISRTFPGQRYAASTLDVVIRHRHRPKAEAVGGALGEVLGERADVARPIAQRRDDDRKHRQAVVEILAERLRLDHRRQIAVRGRDDPDLDVHRPLAADPDDLAVLDHAQQPDLGGERQLADFVEEQRAAVRLLEPALAARGRAGEGALLVPEQLRVDQLRRNRAAVHAAERPARGTPSARESPAR